MMTKKQAEAYVVEHDDDDTLDLDELEEAFAAIYGRSPDAEDREAGLWSLLCAAVNITVRISSKGRNGQIDYEGEIDGNPYRVQIDPAAAPHWYDSNLDDDQRSEVLDAIDAFIEGD